MKFAGPIWGIVTQVSKEDIKIFVTHTADRNTMRITNHPLLYHVIGGSAFQADPIPEGMYCDNQGDNISEKNKSYCELTTQYWAWKNMEADYYGFCHYRRFFSFSNKKLPESEWGTIEYDYLDAKAQKELQLNETDMTRFIRKYDFIIAKSINVRQLGARSVRAHYENAAELHVRDVDILLDVIREKYNFLYKTALQYFKGQKFYPCNMYIMKRELFQKYSELLFGILEEFEKRADMSEYSREGYRTPGHLGERLAGIYYEYLIKESKYRLTEVQIALIHHSDAAPEIKAVQTGKDVPVVLAANQNYIPILYTCVQSIVDHVSDENNYKIYILHTDIDQESRTIFTDRLNRENVECIFINVTTYVSGYVLQAKQHISTETFYRFLILEILKDYSKVIYLDSDMIIRRDLADLFQIDIGDCLIAATKDPDFAGQCNMKNSEMLQYCQNVIGLKNPSLYFQAGVLLFHVAEFNKVTSTQALFEMADTGIYRFSDQDILNIVCKGRVFYLDMAWNMLFDCDHFRWHNVIRYAPHTILDEYEEARKHPYIIHYAGFLKPWMRLGEDFGYAFWETARRTPFYETILLNPDIFHGFSSENIKHKTSKPTHFVLTRKILMKIFKPGSKIRAKLGKIYWDIYG